MRKTLFLTLFLCLSMFAVFAQDDIVLADYEAGSIYPNRTGAWNSANLSLGIANPISDATNGSAQVASLHITSQYSDAANLYYFDEPISLGIYPFVKLKVLTDSAVSTVVTVEVKDLNDYTQNVNFTLPANADAAWTDAVFDFSSIAQNSPITFIKEITIKFDYGTACNANNQHNIYYFDDVRCTGPSLTVSSSDVLTLFSETFGTNCWWDGVSGGDTPMNDLISYFRTVQWGGSVLSAPANHYTLTDSISMTMDGWSGNVDAYFYPVATRVNLSSLTVKEIAIGGFQNININYDLIWKIAPSSFTSSPTIEYSLNGTTWTQVSTTGTLPSANNTWATGLLCPLTGVIGETLYIKVTNNTDGNFMIDNLKVTGNPALVTSISVEGQGGNSIDVDDATKQMLATVLPSAAKQDVLWSVVNGTGKASISTSGVLTPMKNGTVKVIGRALDLYGTVRDTQEVVLTNQLYPITAINIVGEDTLKTDNGQAAYTFNVTPFDADTTSYTVSIVDSAGNAAFSASYDIETKTLTAIKNGYVIIVATANDYKHVTDSLTVVIEGQTFIPVTAIAITGGDSITTKAGTLQLTANYTPTDAELQKVVWSITSVTGMATISADGLVTAKGDGTVLVRATSIDDNSVFGEVQITITNNIILKPTSLAIHSPGDSTTIGVNNGTLALTVEYTPADAEKDIIWGIQGDKFDIATVDSTGLVTAIRNGVVFVQVSSTIDTTVSDKFEITITNQVIEPTSISIVGTDSISSIDINKGSLALYVNVFPADAVKTVKWSIAPEDSTLATISENGLLKASRNGIVTIIATSTVDATIKGVTEITLTNQIVAPVSIEVKGADGATEITTSFGTLQMFATVSPTIAEPNVAWSVAEADVAYASISATGLLTAKANGSVTVIATSTVDENIKGQAKITISGQLILVTDITITAAGDVDEITTLGGTLQLTATVTPDSATIKTVTWSIDDELIASVSDLGLVKALADGVVTVTATANDASGVTGTIELTISNQEIGISSNALNTLYVYPNPVKNTLSITNLKQASKVEIINSNGSVVTVTNEFNTKNVIDVQMLKSGVYVIRAIANETIYQGVFIKE